MMKIWIHWIIIKKDSNCDFALLTTFQGAVCYVVENLVTVNTSIQKIKVSMCLKLIHLLMKDAKEMQKQSDTTLLNKIQQHTRVDCTWSELPPATGGY